MIVARVPRKFKNSASTFQLLDSIEFISNPFNNLSWARWVGKVSIGTLSKKTGHSRSFLKKRLKEIGLYEQRFLPQIPAQYGWTKIDGELKENHQEQHIISTILNLHSKGVGYRSIAKVLDQQKIPTRSKAPWSYQVVRKIILRNKKLKNGGPMDSS